MKKLLLGLVVCFGLMSSAFAADNVFLQHPPRDLISFKDVRTVDHADGKLRLTYVSGNIAEFADPSKVTFNRFVASTLKASFVRVGITNKFYRPDLATKVTCHTSHTFYAWFNSVGEFVDDNCQTYQEIRATAQ